MNSTRRPIPSSEAFQEEIPARDKITFKVVSADLDRKMLEYELVKGSELFARFFLNVVQFPLYEKLSKRFDYHSSSHRGYCITSHCAVYMFIKIIKQKHLLC